MVDCSSSFPPELQNFFTNKLPSDVAISDTEMLDVFNKTLNHLSEITVDKKKLVSQLLKHSSKHPEVQKLAVKILLLPGNESEKQHVERIIDELPNNASPLDRLREIDSLLDGKEIDIENYTQLLNSNINLNIIRSLIKVLPSEERTNNSLSTIYHALNKIPFHHHLLFYNLLLNFPCEKRTEVLNSVFYISTMDISVLGDISTEIFQEVITLPPEKISAYFNAARFALDGMTPSYETLNFLQNLFNILVITDVAFDFELPEKTKNLFNHFHATNERALILINLFSMNPTELNRVIEEVANIVGDSRCNPRVINELISIYYKDNEHELNGLGPYIAPIASTLEVPHIEKVLYAVRSLEPEKRNPTITRISYASRALGYPITEELVNLLGNYDDATLEGIIKKIKFDYSGLDDRSFIKVLKTLNFAPPENRLALLESLSLQPTDTLDLRVGFLSLFPRDMYKEIGEELNERNFDQILLDDFGKIFLFEESMEKLFGSDEIDLYDFVSFISRANLWTESNIKYAAAKDISFLEDIIKSGQRDLVSRYLSSDDGKQQLVYQFTEVKLHENLDQLVNRIYSHDELDYIKTAHGTFLLRTSASEEILNLMSPQLRDYLADVKYFNPVRFLKAPHYEKRELSPSEKREIAGSLKTELSRRNWKGVLLNEEDCEDIDKSRMDLLGFDWVSELYLPNGNALHSEELSTLKQYSINLYLLINGCLDNDGTSIDDWCEMRFGAPLAELEPFQKDEFLKDVEIVETLTELMASGLNKLPPYRGTLYRGDSMPVTELENWEEGKIIATSKFFSCSTKAAISEYFAKDSTIKYMRSKKVEYVPILYVIRSNSAKDISDFSESGDEAERVYLPSQAFEVMEIDRTTVPGLAIISLNEVDPNYRTPPARKSQKPEQTSKRQRH